MTKIQVSFNLSRPLDEQLLEHLANAYSTYGILRIEAKPEGKLTVEYDATRLSQKDVQATLARAGIPVEQRPSEN
jgi:hypothetical protein